LEGIKKPTVEVLWHFRREFSESCSFHLGKKTDSKISNSVGILEHCKSKLNEKKKRNKYYEQNK